MNGNIFVILAKIFIYIVASMLRFALYSPVRSKIYKEKVENQDAGSYS